MRLKQADLMAGIFVLGGAVLIAVIFVIVRGQLGLYDRYHAFFSNVAGLRSGAVVVYEGYTVGSVDSIEPISSDEGMRFRINLDITSGWHIPQDSIAEISAISLLSANAIQIKAGSGERLPVGSEIASMDAVNVMAEISRTADKLTMIAQSNLAPLLDTVRDILDGEGRDALAGMTGLTSQISQQAPEIMTNMKQASQNIANVASASNSASITRTLDNIENTSNVALAITERTNSVVSDMNMARINAAVAHFEQASAKLQTTLEIANRAVRNIEDITDNQNATHINSVLDDISETVSTMNDIVSTSSHTSQVIQDLSLASSDRVEAFLLRMENVSLNLEEMTARIRDNPSLLIMGSQ